MLRLIDSHCHIHDEEFFGDKRQEAYQQTIDSAIGMITVGTDERSSQSAVEFASSHEHAWVAVGVHPHESRWGWGKIENLLKKNDDKKIIAIGEIGLDYYYEHSSRDVQRQALEAQLQLAVDFDIPVTFHVRDGFDDFWPIIANFPTVRGVLHSFTDSQVNADRGMERGFYIGLNGISTFTKDEKQRELYKNLPLDRVLIETDAPYLTPAPFRGKMNIPGYVELVAQFMAKERNLPFEDIAIATLRNTRQLYNI